MDPLRIRLAQPEDVHPIVRLQFDCYPRMSRINAWRPEQVRQQIRVFPQGQFVADLDGNVVGHCANLILPGARVLAAHTYDGITSGGTFALHDPNGDTLYGAEIMVHPSQRRRGVGSSFYRVRFELVRAWGLRRFVSGGRLPGYASHRDRMTPEDYVEAVRRGELHDRTLSMQLRAGLRVRGVIRQYLRDPSSAHYATLLVWENPDLAAREPPPRAYPSLPSSLSQAPERPRAPEGPQKIP